MNVEKTRSKKCKCDGSDNGMCDTNTKNKRHEALEWMIVAIIEIRKMNGSQLCIDVYTLQFMNRRKRNEYKYTHKRTHASYIPPV